MKNISILFIAALSTHSIHAYGYDQEGVRANLAGDYAQCAAYYNLFAAAAADDNAMKEKIGDFLKPANMANDMLLALEAGNIDKAKSRMELATKIEIETLKKEGWARLLLQYADSCKELLEHPDERLKYWKNQQ